MDSGKPWGDYYVLNSAFAEAVEEGEGGEPSAGGWIDPSLVRFWTKLNGRNSKGSSSRSVKVLESLSVSYQVSFSRVLVLFLSFLPSFFSFFSLAREVRNLTLVSLSPFFAFSLA